MTATHDDTELLTIPEVARRLGYRSTRSVYNLVYDGELKLIKLGNGPNCAARIRERDLRAFITRHEVTV